MGQTKFIRTLQENTGWKSSGSALIGQQGGIWFTVAQAGPFQPILVEASVSGLESDRLEQLKSAILAKKKVYKINRFGNENHVVRIVLNTDTSTARNVARATELVADLGSAFARLDLHGGCRLCTAEGGLETVRIGSNPTAICPECHAKLKAEFAGIVERNDFEGNYFTGTVGALLGALVGAAAWLLVSYLGYYASIVGFVMAFLAQSGYRLLKGRIGRAMPAIVLLSVVFGLFVANTVEIAIGLMQDPEIGLTFLESLRIAPLAFVDSEMFYVGRVWGNLGVGLLFALLGSWRTIRGLVGEAKGDIYQVEPI